MTDAIIWVACGVFGTIGAIVVGGKMIYRERWGALAADGEEMQSAMEIKAKEMGYEPKIERPELHPRDWR